MAVELKPSSGKKLYIPKQILEGYGCKNCVWKTYNQCPKGYIDPEESLPEGYCTEFAQFLLGLAEKEDSISAVKEKFMLYTQEMEAMADHMRFHKVNAEYKQRMREGANKRELAELQMKLATYKLWWMNLTNSVTKGLGRIVDREKKTHIESRPQITVQQLNVLLKESDKRLKELE